jgi:hypothetical protein
MPGRNGTKMHTPEQTFSFYGAKAPQKSQKKMLFNPRIMSRNSAS